MGSLECPSLSTQLELMSCHFWVVGLLQVAQCAGFNEISDDQPRNSNQCSELQEGPRS